MFHNTHTYLIYPSQPFPIPIPFVFPKSQLNVVFLQISRLGLCFGLFHTFPSLFSRNSTSLHSLTSIPTPLNYPNNLDTLKPLHLPPFAKQSLFSLRPFATHRDSFVSKYVSDQIEKNFIRVKEVFLNNRPRNKNLLHFIQRCYYLREMTNIHLVWESCLVF